MTTDFDWICINGRKLYKKNVLDLRLFCEACDGVMRVLLQHELKHITGFWWNFMVIRKWYQEQQIIGFTLLALGEDELFADNTFKYILFTF